jgi:hypothetical protein
MPDVTWAATCPRYASGFIAARSFSGGDYLPSLAEFARKRDRPGDRDRPSAGFKFKIAAKIDRADQAYLGAKIWPMIENDPEVEFIGEIDERQRATFPASCSNRHRP